MSLVIELTKKSDPIIIDGLVAEAVFPLLVHFGEQGIAPRVVSAMDESILKIEFVEGPRLGEYISKCPSEESLISIYRQLGQRIGYINKYNAIHSDLDVFNIVINEKLEPILIDWDKAHALILDLQSNESEDIQLVLSSSEQIFTAQGNNDLFLRLKEVLLTAFREEVAKAPVHTYFDLTEAAMQKIV